MFTSSPACHNQIGKSSKFQRQLETPALRIFLSKAFQALMDNAEDCGIKVFNATNFYRFHVHFFKLFSTQCNDHTDSYSLINTLLLHFLRQDHSLNKFNDHKNTDAHNFYLKKVINVFTQTEFDTSSGTDVSPKHGYSRDPENLLNQFATQFSSLKFLVDDQFSSLKKDTLLVNYAHIDYLSSYTATFPCHEPSARSTKVIQDSIQSY